MINGGGSPRFDQLIASAGIKKLKVELPAYGKTIVIVVKKDKKVIDKEEVKRNENVDKAAGRLYGRLKKERIIG